MVVHRAAGIQDHPRYKTGRRPPKRAPALMLADVLTGIAPAHPATADHLRDLPFGLYENDKYGDCGPTSAANYVRLISAGLLGAEIIPHQGDVFNVYKASGNPNFDPNDPGGPGDGGVDMQTMLEAMLKVPLGGIVPICFAKVDVSSDQELNAATSIFGGLLWGVNLLVAQQSQTDATPPSWTYVNSGEWGGHAVLGGTYDETTKVDRLISWALKVGATASFRAHQLEEAWVPIYEMHLDHPAFQAGVDVQALADAYHALTGKTIPALPAPAPPPVPPPPVPTPDPTPPPEPTPTPVPPGGGGEGRFRVGPFTDRVAARLGSKAAARGMTIEEYITYHVQFGSSHWSN